jgi:folate-binding protein YgfZ
MQRLSLHEFHEVLGAHFAELTGMECVADYGDATTEYEALTQKAGLLDLSFRSRLCLTGADRVRFLHGQVTNEVKNLPEGSGSYAALITAKGKMQSDLNIYRLPEELLLDFEPGLAATVSARLEKYVIADDVQLVNVAPMYGLLSVQGPSSAEVVVQSLKLVSPLPSGPLRFSKIPDPNFGEIYLVNNPRLGRNGFDLFAPAPVMAAAAEKLLAAVTAAGGRACGWQALEVARIEAGIPRFGADMDESNIPLEAGLEQRAVSFNKGCYIGQEVISRIHTHGQVAKALRGLRLETSLKDLPKKGDELLHDGKAVGYVTSATTSPKLQLTIVLGYVRKEVNQPGSSLELATSAGKFPAKIVPLPFV